MGESEDRVGGSGPAHHEGGVRLSRPPGLLTDEVSAVPGSARSPSEQCRNGLLTPTILITGAAGNLGSLLARHLLAGRHPLRLMYHRRPLPDDVARAPNVGVIQADL